MRAHVAALAIALLLIYAMASAAQEPAPQAEPDAAPSAAAPEAAAGDELSVEQARLADRYKRLEEVLGQLAEFSASSDPRRAKLLREALALSRENDINVRFESIVKLLEDERLSAATNNQKELHQELEALLNLLLKADRDKELASQRDQIKRYLKEVVRILRMQKGVRARTEGGDDLSRLGQDQKQIADDTKKLGGDVSDHRRDQRSSKKEDETRDADKKHDEEPKQSDGNASKQSDASKQADAKSGEPKQSDSSKPSESQPSDGEPSDQQPSESADNQPSPSGQPQNRSGQPSPSPSQGDSGEQSDQPQEPTDRAAERLRGAAQQMENARKKLEEAQRKGAADRQREAMRELELAKADLERVLRQLREEELERTLTQLSARFKRMLELQNQVYEGTLRLDEVPKAKRDHDDEIEAARLSRQEVEIVQEADKALILLREEGSSVAFPEILEQARDDMRQVVERLAAVKVGSVTQVLEEDIIAALEEGIAALEQARKDLEKKRRSPGGQSGGGQSEQELVHKLAELKLIRSLQMRINTRTQRYGKMIEGEQAETDDLLEALQDLSQRQERVHRAITDLEQGIND